MAIKVAGTTVIDNSRVISNLGSALSVGNGGLGTTTLTAENILVGNTTGPVKFIAPGTTGNVLTSNGSNWISSAISAGGNLIMRVYSSPSTYVKPSGIKAIKVTVVGGGGGGSNGGGSPGGGGGGGGGGAAIRYLTASNPVFPSSPISVTVGSGGPAGGYPVAPSGGTSSFGSIASATGGVGGSANPAPGNFAAGGIGGVGSSGDINIGGHGGHPNAQLSATGGQTVGGNGGSSILGGGGTGRNDSSSDSNGRSVGGGGGGTTASNTGGNGQNGIVIVEEYY